MTTRTHGLIYTLPFIAGLLLSLVLNATNPLDGGPGVILLVFILLYVLCASVLFIVLHIGVAIVSRLWARRSLNAREWRIGVKKAYYIASVLAFGPVLILAMQSVGQLQIQDVLLVAALLALAIFYVIRRS